MLAELYVKNFALIENLQIEFHEGLNVITGETGAGKSLLTDAVGLLMGGRADKDFIRYGCKRALVEGTFTGPFSSYLNEILAENDMAEDTIVIGREISAEGKNLCRMNGRRVSLSFLETLVPMLMNLHSQTEHFSLLQEEHQLSLLDRFGGERILAAKVDLSMAYDVWLEASNQRKALEQKNQDRERQMDFLKFRIDELRSLNLHQGEEEELRHEIALLSSSDRRYSESEAIFHALSDATESLYNAVEAAKRACDFDESLISSAESLSEAYYTVEDASDFYRHYRDNIDSDPVRLNEAEERLDLILRMEKKYHKDCDGILAELASMERALEAFEDFDYHVDCLRKEEDAARNVLTEKAQELTDLRVAAAERLSALILEEIRGLMLPNAVFQVALEEQSLTREGKDRVMFMISMNKGEQMKPLSKVASGGEMSRILLGIKVILAKMDQIDTMIFDEIDSGLGGKTAAKVGEKLRLLSRNIQVFSVTHSAIVASCADYHYRIEKHDENGRTVTTITELVEEERKREIARMLSGDEDSEVSLSQAESLMSIMMSNSNELK